MRFLLITLLIIVASAAYAGFSAAPWVPTKKRQRELLKKHLALKPGEVFYDLGCGDGTVLFTLARAFPQTQFIGCEISLLPYFIARAHKLIGGAKYKNVSIRFKSLHSLDISNADYIFVFLLARALQQLAPKFTRELKPGATLITEAWPLPNVEHDAIWEEEGVLPMYVYVGREGGS